MQGEAWTKAISRERDRAQAHGLTAVVLVGLAVACGNLALRGRLSAWPLGISVVFAVVVWALRSATAPAAAAGALICLLLSTASPTSPAILPGGTLSVALLPLLALFLLTFAATRYKRAGKEHIGLAEGRGGRRASQIIANLGVAGLCAGLGFFPGALAALAEATADTVSSEIGQALGGPTWLFTTGRRVAPGTDGGVSLRGSLLGLAGAVVVTAAGAHGLSSVRVAASVFGAATAGFLLDSLLGATAERRGWIGNDLVNFTSTAAAAGAAWMLLLRMP